MTQLTTVQLYGELGDLFGKEFKFGVKTPIEAVRVLEANFPDFSKYLWKNKQLKYHIYVGEQTIPETELAYPVASNKVIKIVPVIAGSSDNPMVNIVLGAALIAVAPWAALTFGTSTAGAYAIAGAVANVGYSLVLAGVTGVLLAPPTPDAPAEKPENKPSYLFNGVVNTMKQGNPVPVGYGRLRIGSQVISAGISTQAI